MSGVLLVEDDQFKREKIIDALKSQGLADGLVLASSVHMAVRELEEHAFDLIILDMALPSHTVGPGESPPNSMLSGGMEVIMELSYRGRNDPLIVLTQYPEIEIEGELLDLERSASKLKEMFGSLVRATILYEHQGEEWKRLLDQALGRL